jgi:hypothetical protein
VRTHGKKPPFPGRGVVLRPRNPHSEGGRQDHSPSARGAWPAPRASAFLVCLPWSCLESVRARELLAESVESRWPVWTARSAACCPVCTVPSGGAGMPLGGGRRTQAMSAGRSLSSWPRPGSPAVGAPAVVSRPGSLAPAGPRGARAPPLPRDPPTAAPARRTGRQCAAPTPAIARPPRPPHLWGKAVRGPRQAPEPSGQQPGHPRALAAIPACAGEVMAGARAARLLPAAALQGPGWAWEMPQGPTRRRSPRGPGRGRPGQRNVWPADGHVARVKRWGSGAPLAMAAGRRGARVR